MVERLVSHPETAAALRRSVERGRIHPYGVPEVRAQLIAVPDPARREALLRFYDLVSARVVGQEGQVAGPTVLRTDRDVIRRELLAAARALEVDVLVTEDDELALLVQRGEGGACQVWSLADLRAALTRFERRGGA